MYTSYMSSRSLGRAADAALLARDVPVVDVIRDAIRQRLLAPGAALVQSTLASALGVSKIPVREALHALASEGLVTFTSDGARVTTLTTQEVDELWSLRALLEPALAHAIVRNAGPTDIASLQSLVKAMDDAASGDAWSDLNYTFHLELYRIAALPHFAAAAARVLTQIDPHSRVAVNRLSGQAAAQAEHHELLVALERRDPEALRETLERHSTRARELLVGYTESPPSEPAAATAVSDAARAFAARLEHGT
jgi:DNA-binding GntR family transcriptional regulator